MSNVIVLGKAWIIAAALITLIAIGCAPKRSRFTTAPAAANKPPLVAMVSVDVPGASPELVDGELSAMFLSKASVILGARAVTCISRHGSFEAYVQADPNADIAALRDQLYAALPTRDLPSSVGKPDVRFVKDGVPKVTPKDVPTLEINLDRDKCVTLGISPGDLTKQLSDVPPPYPARDRKAIDNLKAMIITNTNGNQVRLGDVATFTVENKPDCIVRNYPSR